MDVDEALAILGLPQGTKMEVAWRPYQAARERLVAKVGSEADVARLDLAFDTLRDTQRHEEAMGWCRDAVIVVGTGTGSIAVTRAPENVDGSAVGVEMPMHLVAAARTACTSSYGVDSPSCSPANRIRAWLKWSAARLSMSSPIGSQKRVIFGWLV